MEEQMKKAVQGQLDQHFAKIEKIEEFNPGLADRIRLFTDVLAENNYCGVFDVDDDVYHNGIGISQSRFSYLDKSPSNYFYKTYVNIQDNLERKTHFSEGDFIHRVLLEPGTVAEKFCDEGIAYRLAELAKPEAVKIRATKVYKDKIKELREQGFEPIRKDLFQTAYMFEQVIDETPELKNLLSGALKEKAIYCMCPVTGLIRKSKVDILKAFDDYIYIGDVKSTKDIDDDKFDWSVYNYKYHVQGAYYEGIARDALSKKIDQHLIVVIEKYPPFEVGLKFIDHASMDIGARECAKYMKTLAACYATGDFPRNKIEVKACGIPASKMKDEMIEMDGEVYLPEVN